MAQGQDPTVARQRLRDALRRQREAAGLTQRQVADELDWSPILRVPQNPLYRFLAGYVLWPGRAQARGTGRRLAAKHELRDRLDSAWPCR